MYDALAPHFRAWSTRRAAYLAGIDAIVLERVHRGARSLLDVGAGDGVRAMRLAAACGIDRVVLVEPSPAMADLCRRRGAAAVWTDAVEELPEAGERFDVVTCLWNVLGSVPGAVARAEALRRMRARLAPGGQLFLDVQNRYNARAYGRLRTAGRVLYDRLRPDPANGDVTFCWQIGGETIPARGHVFRPGEIASLVAAAGFSVASRHVVDYASGERRRPVWSGQLLFELVC